MATANAAASGTFKIGGDLPVHRLGFGAMRIVGKGVWGPAENGEEVRKTVARVPELGINFIDTADSYGPYLSEDIIAEKLAPYAKGLVIATKGGLTRHGPDSWPPLGRPEYLRQCVLMSLRRLKLERLDLWQLHRIDAKVPRAEQFDCIAQMQKEGLIRHVGLSECTVEDIDAAEKHFKVATVQNLFNLGNRQSEDVLDHCERKGIGFIPWFPLAAGSLAKPGGVLDQVAKAHKVTDSAIALAWLLERSPVMLPIPGTGQVKHLEDNVVGATVKLTREEFTTLDQKGKDAWKSSRG